MKKPPIPSERIEVYQSRGDWLAARTGKSQHRIGASDVAAILGVSPWAGPWDIWTQRQGLKPPIDPARERAFARGHRYEIRALQDFAEESGVYTCQTWAIWAPDTRDAQVIVVGEVPWTVCSPDALVYRHASQGIDAHWGGAEAKTTSEPQYWGPTQEIPSWQEQHASVVPPQYALQCYWSLEVTGLPSWTLIILLPWYEVRWYVIHRDEEIQRSLLDAVGEWRERHLVRGEAPDIASSDACGSWLSQRFPGGKPQREATDREAMVVRRLRDLGAQARSIGQERDLLKNMLRASIGDATRLLLPGGGSYTPRRTGTAPQRDDAEVDPLDFGDSLI